MPYNIVTYGSLDVFYTDDIDGGGRTFGQDYVSHIAENIGPVDRLFEWCAGPAFIGFALLAAGLCKSLCLADINPRALRACMETVRMNRLWDRVTIYLSDCLTGIPASEKWDLVVGNPPHSSSDELHPLWGPPLIYRDIGWNLHRRFYVGIHNYLKTDSNVIIQENRELSTAETFREMIAAGGLSWVGSYPCRTEPNFYYVHTKRYALRT